jgi:hypothetical protein
MKQYLDSKGFFEVNLDNKWFKVHRLMAMCFLPENNEATDAKHRNGNKTDNRLGNLEWMVDGTRRFFDKEFSRKAYGWSKYGEVNYGLVQEDKTREWNCQACGDKQTKDMPSYMMELIEREFVRICSSCQHVKLSNSLSSLYDLVYIVRKHHLY